MEKKIGIIGVGSMGSAIALGLGSQTEYKLYLYNRSPEKLNKLRGIIDFIKVEELANMLKENMDYIILASKPQHIPDILNELKTLKLNEKTVLVSVAAGFTIESINEFFSDNPIARVMPNTPAQISAAMSAISVNPKAQSQITELESIFQNIGETVLLDNEEQMHASTAIAGSGPAYFFKIIEALSKAGEKQGLKLEEAEKLAIETMYGAALLLKKSQLSPSELRVQVTSPNGTTQAALESFNESKIDQIVSAAVEAACARSKELAKRQ